MSNPIAILCLLLTTGTLAVLGGDMDKYMRQDGTFTNIPYVTISGASDTTCAISCTLMEPWLCGGFTYHDSGTCDLYRGSREATSINPLETASSLQVDTGPEPRSYRRLRSACPGTVSDPCGCPAGFSRCAGRCLRFLDQTSTYDEAEAACEALGAHLAVPRSEEENQCAWSMTGGQHTWLGVTDRDAEGTFVGVDGGCVPVPASKAWWRNGEPNDNTGNEDCAIILGRAHAWAAKYCYADIYNQLCQLRNCHQPQCQ